MDAIELMQASYSVETMGNGLTLIRCRKSGLRGCYATRNGQYRHGDLSRLDADTAKDLIRSHLIDRTDAAYSRYGPVRQTRHSEGY